MNKLEKTEKLLNIRKNYKKEHAPYYSQKEDSGFFPLSKEIRDKIRKIQLEHTRKHKDES